MKLRIIVSYVPRYQRGHEWDFVPPVTGIHLAALAGSEHVVEVVHEQVRAPVVDSWPDLVAISFFSGFAERAYAVADAYRTLGVPVVLGGPHASYWIDEALAHADAVVVGEAESVWQELLTDFEQDRVTEPRVYRGEARPLVGLPTPRYDLLEPRFVVPRVVQATRGCPFSCSFCSVPISTPAFACARWRTWCGTSPVRIFLASFRTKSCGSGTITCWCSGAGPSSCSASCAA